MTKTPDGQPDMGDLPLAPLESNHFAQEKHWWSRFGNERRKLRNHYNDHVARWRFLERFRGQHSG